MELSLTARNNPEKTHIFLEETLKELWNNKNINFLKGRKTRSSKNYIYLDNDKIKIETYLFSINTNTQNNILPAKFFGNIARGLVTGINTKTTELALVRKNYIQNTNNGKTASELYVPPKDGGIVRLKYEPEQFLNIFMYSLRQGRTYKGTEIITLNKQ